MKKWYFVTLIISLFIFSSCVTVKQVKYLNDAGNNNAGETNQQAVSYYKIQTGDQLYVKILSLDDKSANFFNADAADFQNVNETKLYLTSYEVNDSGYIQLPLAGKINVKNLTIEEARVKVQQVVDEYLNQATVIVKLTSFRLTILGEVARPGKFIVLSTQINIFEALGNAGDITDYGNKQRVLLIRQTTNGSQTIYINLKDKAILSSPNYYLQPNDILYIEPLPEKSFGARSFTFSNILATLTTAFSALSTMIVFLNYTK